MVAVNPIDREIQLKIVYYGPGLGGKTTTLKHIYGTTEPEHRGKMVSLATPVDRTLYFDYLPVRLPDIGGYTLKLQLFTVPGQVHFNATRKLVLSNADGVVFVADSQISRADANLESLDNLHSNLAEYSIDIESFPLVFQYNKRDLESIVPIDVLEESLNRMGRPSLGTCATSGENIYEGLELITKSVLRDLKQRDILARAEPLDETRSIDFKRREVGLAERLKEYSENTVRLPMEKTLKEISEQIDSSDQPLHEAGRPGAAESSSHPPPAVDRPTIPAPLALSGKVMSDQRGSSMRRSFVSMEPRPRLAAVSFSFSPLWPDGDRRTALRIEQAIADNRCKEAVGLIKEELDRIMARYRKSLPSCSEATVLAMIGLESKPFMEITLLNATASTTVTSAQALSAYLYLLNVMEADR